ncbi:alpha/beta fold hydrolase [Ensifer sp. T173]|uniref:Alpha/beta fold hydrolase n=2 Tax=Ensifer canadensis TaxID=555315 RepID=A0AAW4FRT7_9HYPH|nr:alpha/beta fold hydrolase [Ensifer canadensis]UBI81065.1 alpha/beta fold hydrolase [Ensifer canadensis]
MKNNSRDLLITMPGDNPGGRRLLLCAPAGGGASIWKRLGPSLTAGWSEVISICMPGREQRFSEAPFSTLGDAIGAIADALPEGNEDDLVIFGHSFGALVGFGVASALEQAGRKPIKHLFVSGRVAPSHSTRNDLHRSSDKDLREMTKQLGGTPAEVLANDEMWRLYSAALRLDLKLGQNWIPDRLEQIAAPITALAGSFDPLTDDKGLSAWAQYTRGPFSRSTFPYGHFFPFENPSAVFEVVRAQTDPIPWRKRHLPR